MSPRRHTDPVHVQHVWDAISVCKRDKNVTDLKHLIQYMVGKLKRYSNSQAELYIIQTSQDNLIESRSSFRNGVETFRVSMKVPDTDGKDWYCYECHLAGNVGFCKNCHRVYHWACAETRGKKKFENFKRSLGFDTSHDAYNPQLCSICNIAEVELGVQLTKTETNLLLGFILKRIELWLPSKITHKMSSAKRKYPLWMTAEELSWRAKLLFFDYKDCAILNEKVTKEDYNFLHEFLADIYTIQHNVAVFHGIESQEYGAAEYMIFDTLHDFAEIRNCSDCYKHSNEKLQNGWFALPCKKPHTIVWAKQKGWPFWPAKVMKQMDDHYDVRFFGSKHERSTLNERQIKPISTPEKTLQIKTTASFKKAMDELNSYRKFLLDPSALKQYLNSPIQKPAAQKPAKNSIGKTPPKVARMSEDAETEASKPKVTRRRSAKVPKISTEREGSPVDDKPTVPKTPKKRGRPSRGGQPTNTPETPAKTPERLKKTPNRSKKTPVVLPVSTGRRSARLQKKEEIIIPSANEPVILADLNDVLVISDDESSVEVIYNRPEPPVVNVVQEIREPRIFEPRIVESVTLSSPISDMRTLYKPYSDEVEMMRRKLETMSDRKSLIKCAVDCMQREIDRITEKHNARMREYTDSHNVEISETKRKQWCFNCEQDAIYYCCWNTSYCSIICQEQHWQAEHKKTCRRKR